MDISIRELGREDINSVLPLTSELNPDIPAHILKERLEEMFSLPYKCFGAYLNGNLIGICGAWITTRLYSGRQIELDNLIIAHKYRSKGLGSQFLDAIDRWAKEQGCVSCELNSYIANDRSHKFYLNRDFQRLGFHFVKKYEDNAYFGCREIK